MLRRETVVEVVVCGDAVAIVFGLEGLDEDGVGFAVPGNHDVLVTAARPWSEAPSVIREDMVDGDGVDNKCWRGCGCVGRKVGGCDCSLCGADVLAWLRHVPTQGFVGIGTVTCSQGVGEPWPRFVCSTVDSRQPCLLDGVSRCSVVVGDECWCIR